MKTLVHAIPAVLVLTSMIGCAAPADPEPASARVDISGPASASAADALTVALADGPQLDALLAALRTSAGEGARPEDRVRVVVTSAGQSQSFEVPRRTVHAWSTPLAAGDATVVHLPAFIEKSADAKGSQEGDAHALVFGWSWNDVVITVKYTVGCYQTLSNGDVVDNCKY